MIGGKSCFLLKLNKTETAQYVAGKYNIEDVNDKFIPNKNI